MCMKQLILASSFQATPGLLAFLPWAGSTGEYYSSQYLLCYDCHTKHDGHYASVKNGQVADRGR